MKKILLVALQCILTLSAFGQCTSYDSTGFKESEFDALVKEKLESMIRKDTFDNEGLYCLLKTYNTVLFSNQFKEKPDYNKFIDSFMGEYMKQAYVALSCIISSGFVAYSPAYDIYICPCLQFHPNDYFKVIWDE